MTAMIKGKDICSVIKEIHIVPRIGESICFWHEDNVVTKKVIDIVYFVTSYDIIHRIEIYV
jgi:hypothetical protein